MKALINKKTLKRICDVVGISENYISEKCGIDLQRVSKYLDIDCDDVPSFSKAKEIAKKIHVPFAGLHMNPSDVPYSDIKPKIKSFRSFNSEYIDESAINIAINDLLISRKELLDTYVELGRTPAVFKNEIRITADIKDLANKIREYFSIDIEEQISFTSTRKFFIYLRGRIEEKGIVISSFSDVPIEMLRGIAIYDSNYPIIGYNVDDYYPAKTFTIIHELTHIIKRQSATCNEMGIVFTDNQEEVFCNAVAGEVLVPESELIIRIDKHALNEDVNAVIQKLSELFSVSREVITRRLLDTGFIRLDQYKECIDLFATELRREKERQREENRQARIEGRTTGYPKEQYWYYVKKKYNLNAQIFPLTSDRYGLI